MASSTADTKTPDRFGDERPLILAHGFGFVALALVLLTALESMWDHLFTLTPATALPWGYWASVLLAVLAATGYDGQSLRDRQLEAEA